MRYSNYFFLIGLFFIRPVWADIHLSLSEKAIQVTGKSKIDQAQGNLTSFISPSLGLVIQASIKEKFKLNFSGQVTNVKFSAPYARILKDPETLLKKYSVGFLYLLSDNKEWRFDLGFEDFPFFANTDQNNITLTKSNATVINSTYKQTLSSPFIFNYELSVEAISPIVNDYDQGRLGFGYGLALGKEIKNDGNSYNIATFYGSQYLPMKNLLIKKDELGIRFLIKIPIKSKTVL